MKKTAILKQVVCILLAFCFLASLVSCQVRLNNSNGQTDEQTEEQTTEQATVETTEEESETETEAETEVDIRQKLFQIELTKKGTLTIYYQKENGSYIGRSVYKVKKCYAKIAGSLRTHELSVNNLGGSSKLLATSAYYDLIYVIFESGHTFSDQGKAVIADYGILYGYQ